MRNLYLDAVDHARKYTITQRLDFIREQSEKFDVMTRDELLTYLRVVRGILLREKSALKEDEITDLEAFEKSTTTFIRNKYQADAINKRS